MSWQSTEGSTRRLIQLCVGYFAFYVVTGVGVKYFLGKPELGLPGMDGVAFLTYSTLGGTLVCLVVAIAFGWYRIESSRRIRWMGMSIPQELLYIVPSGVCTGVVIPTTTLMYSLPISVMVAMVIMRGSVIIISRCVDALQIRQGILKKKVYREEDVAVAFALAAVGVHVLIQRDGGFEFLSSVAAVTILGSYITAYAFRIYIMNYYKNTRGKGVKQDNKGFFALEQFAATGTLVLAAVLAFNAPTLFGWNPPQVETFRASVLEPAPQWLAAITLGGMPFGAVAFFSVFIFMFKGRTATFAGLVNRLTSLMAGTAATLISFVAFGGRFPEVQDWISLAFILVAVGFLTVAERRRAAELAASKEIPPPEPDVPASPAAPAVN